MAALLNALGSIAKRQAGGLDYNAAPPNLSTLANNSIYDTWRPKAHVLPPSNHIGDPCMHYTDPKTGLFHVGYLYSSDNSSGAAGAVTDDLVTYRDVKPGEPLFISPGGINDPVAVFDGSVIPSGINDSATLLYTSVSYLPIHWTIPYTKGAETASLAVSYDGGANFTKVRQGPVIPGAPQGSDQLNVTAFRDPYVFQNQYLDTLLGSDNGTWYNVISGGVHDVGGSQFLYRQIDPEFRDWEYLGEWWKEPVNSTWGDGTWAGRWAFNFEVANVFTLSETGYGNEDVSSDFFTTIGTEGGDYPVPLQQSPDHDMLWINGNVSMTENGTVTFEPTMAGVLDWGIQSYAAAGKLLPASSKASQKSGTTVDRFLSYVWLTNDDYGQSDFPKQQQGWDGTLLTARELSKGTISNVVDNDLVNEKASWLVTARNASAGTVELTTLRQKIVREAYSAFTENATEVYHQPACKVKSNSDLDFTPSSKFYVMQASIDFPKTARGNDSDVKAGFRILDSDSESTSIYYQFSNETLMVDRSNSSAAAALTPGIQTYAQVGKLRLFDILQPSGKTEIETLDLTIIVDNAVVEVWANDRFVLSTWVWSWYNASNKIGYIVEGSEEVSFGNVTVYEGLVDAWPERS